MSRPEGSGRPRGFKTHWGDTSPGLHDGYRVHQNPDGSCVFVEGRRYFREKRQWVWTRDEETALNAEAGARGVSVEQLQPVVRHEWERGYYCAVAALVRQGGIITTQIRELFKSGGNPQHADECDKELFRATGLMPNGELCNAGRLDKTSPEKPQ